MTKLLLVIGSIGFILCTLLFIYYPAFPHSILGWLALIFIGLPVWFFLEWLGGRVLGTQFFNQLSSPMRITIAIPFVIALIILCFYIGQFVQKLVEFS